MSKVCRYLANKKRKDNVGDESKYKDVGVRHHGTHRKCHVN